MFFTNSGMVIPKVDRCYVIIESGVGFLNWQFLLGWTEARYSAHGPSSQYSAGD